jgi:hypothetical protein
VVGAPTRSTVIIPAADIRERTGRAVIDLALPSTAAGTPRMRRDDEPLLLS